MATAATEETRTLATSITSTQISNRLLVFDGRRAEPAPAAAMKCTQHPHEQGAGVCASCLRERLLALLASRSGLPHHRQRRQSYDKSPSPPVAFPRSVSPYLPHRSSGASHRHDPRFFSTPQLGPTFGGSIAGGRPRSSARFSFLKGLLGHRRSEKAERDWGSCEESGSVSWFSSLIHRKKKKKEEPSFFTSTQGEAPLGKGRRPFQVVGRGMSPAMEDELTDESGYWSETSNGWRRPTPTPVRRTFVSGRSHYHHHQSFSGFAVWKSPLMRAGTEGVHSRGAEAAGFSGDLQKPACADLRYRRSTARSGLFGLGPSRSRKLADIGRFK